MVTDPAHELAKIRPALERIALALESIAKKTDPNFKTTAELDEDVKRNAPTNPTRRRKLNRIFGR
jgi:hypothetical protein